MNKLSKLKLCLSTERHFCLFYSLSLSLSHLSNDVFLFDFSIGNNSICNYPDHWWCMELKTQTLVLIKYWSYNEIVHDNIKRMRWYGVMSSFVKKNKIKCVLLLLVVTSITIFHSIQSKKKRRCFFDRKKKLFLKEPWLELISLFGNSVKGLFWYSVYTFFTTFFRSLMTTHWHLSSILSTEQNNNNKFCLIVLNQPIVQIDTFQRLWHNGTCCLSLGHSMLTSLFSIS